MTNRWNNKADFGVAIKAAAFEAARLVRQSFPTPSNPMAIAREAARRMDLIDEAKPAINVNMKVIDQCVYALAFSESHEAYVELQIDLAWREYAGMGTKAVALYEHTAEGRQDMQTLRL